MSSGRFRVELIEEPELLPVLGRPAVTYRPPPRSWEEHALATLIEAIELLRRRGPGRAPWAASYRQHPLAFLLDSMSDAIRVWTPDGELVYQNHAIAGLDPLPREPVALERFDAGGHRFERRCLRCELRAAGLVIEIIRELH